MRGNNTEILIYVNISDSWVRFEKRKGYCSEHCREMGLLRSGRIMVGFPEGLKEVQKIERGNWSTGRAFQAHVCNAAPTGPRQEA